MTVILRMVSKKFRGGQRENVYVENIQKILSIAKGQLDDAPYKFVEIWEPKDLER